MRVIDSIAETKNAVTPLAGIPRENSSSQSRKDSDKNSKRPASSTSCSLWEEGTFLSFRVSLGARPACQHKGNLVHEIGDVVSHIERLAASSLSECAKEVTCWVDGPAQGHDDAHVVERLLDGSGCRSRCLSRLTSKDLEENKGPAGQATTKSSPWVHVLGLAGVAKGKHGDSANQEFPEACWADRSLGCLQDEVELNHLQWDGDAPVDVPVDDWALVDIDPVLAHVHVVNCSNECHQSSNMERCLPMPSDCPSFGIEENCRGNHGNRDDPEGHGREIMLTQECLCGVFHSEG